LRLLALLCFAWFGLLAGFVPMAEGKKFNRGRERPSRGKRE
jgi:hypothetical protein